MPLGKPYFRKRLKRLLKQREESESNSNMEERWSTFPGGTHGVAQPNASFQEHTPLLSLAPAPQSWTLTSTSSSSKDTEMKGEGRHDDDDDDDDEQPCIEYATMIPLELWIAVFSWLVKDSESVHTVRLTCRTFRDAAWKAFGYTFDNKVFHPLCQSSLQRMAELADCERLTPYVSKLQLSTASFTNAGLETLDFSLRRTVTALVHGLGAVRTVVPSGTFMREEVRKCYKARVEETQRYENGMYPLRGTFETALVKLKQLSIVSIVDVKQLTSPPHWPELGQSIQKHFDEAHRNGFPLYDDEAAWNFLSGFNLSSSLLHSAQIHESAQKRLLRYLTYALGNASLGSRVQRLLLRGGINIMALPPSTTEGADFFPLVPDCSMDLFPALTKLDLRLTYRWPASGSPPPSDLSSVIPKFLLGMPNLKDLRIDFPPLDEATGSALFGKTHFIPIASLPAFTQLTKLRLENLHPYSLDLLQCFLGKHAATLKELTLVQISLPSAEWGQLPVWMEANLELETFTVVSKPTKWLRAIAEADRPSWATWRRSARNSRLLMELDGEDEEDD